MANLILYQSSLLSGIIQLFILYLHNVPFIFKLTVISGIISSITNHAYTSWYLKITDRAVMAIGFIIHGSYMNLLIYKDNNYILTWIIMISAVLLYLSSKLFSSNNLHLLSHLALLILHLLMSYYLHEKCLNNEIILCY